MIKIDNPEVCGFEASLRGMRNPKNSWDKSDSTFIYDVVGDLFDNDLASPELGDNDLKLAKTLANAGTDHGKFLRFIHVYCDITAPLYWWKEFDTYRMGVEKNSCSTMHKIHEKRFTLDDFSHEHLFDATSSKNPPSGVSVLELTIHALNDYRDAYLCTKDKDYWWQMIQLLPSSYNQKRTVMMSYSALRNMYHARKFHKLDEWREFCLWVESLPYSELITGEDA